MASPQPRTAFILIDVQDGLTHPTHWGPARSNPSFEQNTAQLLTTYRKLLASDPSPSPRHIIVHIQHSSTSPLSPLHPSVQGFSFQPFATPLPNELTLTKIVNSAFISTPLESILRTHFAGEAGKVYLAGLTTDHCVNTKTRMAGNLKVADGKDGEEGEVIFVEDATACWKKEEGGFEAEVVHGVSTESLREFSRIGKTQGVVGEWEGWV